LSYIDIKFARLVGGRLDKFKEKKSGLYNFRCPYCGDSQKHQNKARGYFFMKQNDIIFKCHNCGVGRTLSNFLKDHARDLYDEFVMERYKEGLTGKHRRTPNPIIPKSKPKFKTGSNLPSISSLNKEHPARKYLEQRRIPSDKLDRLYYADKFKTYVNTQKHTFDDLRNDQPRIIIPLIDGDGNWFGIQGRSLSSRSKLRYITIIFDEDKPKLFGLDKIDYEKPIYIVEGPFDSLFLDNAVAMAGSDVDIRTFGWSNYIWVYDNEPRNRQITDRISNAIDRGDKVVIWPQSVTQKDLNDMVLTGHNVQNLIECNSYSGLQAKLKLTTWKKV
tara:strand:- start:694 stop:1686 length:993 start_codon:yes stop_codon:yes gene_type:complete